MSTIDESTLISIVNDWTKANANSIVKGLETRSPDDMLQYERTLLRVLLQLGALIMAWILKTRIENKLFQAQSAERVLPSKSKKYRFVCYQRTPIRTLFNNIVQVECRYYFPLRTCGRKHHPGNKGKKGSGLFPALEVLGIRDGSTPALASEVARAVTDGPSMEAAQEQLSRWGITLDIKVIRRISETFARIGLMIRKNWLENGGQDKTPLIPEDETFEGKRILIGLDGGRIRTRKIKRGCIPEGKKKHGFETPWREPKLLTIRTIDDQGKVIRKNHPIYDGTLDDADAVFELLKAHLKAREVHKASEIICAGDGAPWIWERMDNILVECSVELQKVSHVVDFYHAVEHLTKVAESRRGWNEKMRRRWLKKMRKLLRRGRVDQVIIALRGLAKGRNARAVKREIEYFERHQDRMRYADLEQRKLPLGNGTTESAIRQVVNLRLKGTGMFWEEKNAEGFLHLRCYLKAKRWPLMECAVINYGLQAR